MSVPVSPQTPVAVFVPHRNGLPPMRAYLRDLWRRRAFASEMSRATLRASNSTTVLGQLWLILNPLLLAGVYYLLVMILRGGRGPSDFFPHLVVGLFAFQFVAGALNQGAKSVVGGGRLILNMSFPRLLLPLMAVRTSWMRFLPTLAVMLVITLLWDITPTATTLVAIPALLLLVIFAVGVTSLLATIQVYFRDLASFLPYITRIWLYATPILWFIDDVPASLAPYLPINPLYGMIGIWSDAIVRHELPPTWMWIHASAWAVSIFIVGTLFFMSREREFAVRL